MGYLKDSFIVSLFLFLLIHNMALLLGLVAITTGVGVEKSKNVLPSFQKPRVLISTLASFELFDVQPCSSPQDNGVSLDSVLVSLHTYDIILVARSRKSLCRIYIQSHLSYNSYYAEYQIYKDKMLVDC